MRLVDLNPRWMGAGGEGITDGNGDPVPERKGIGLSFDCPCGCEQRGYVSFTNPLDGGDSHRDLGEQTWRRTGETFDTLTLTPSILRSEKRGGCNWHGFITEGEVKSV